ncbi:MAG: dockerin type I domain-containing protein [Candidatus Zixiibacteriota bacterium]
MKKPIILLLTLTALILIPGINLFALDWPVWPDSVTHVVGACYGLFQSETFLHNGIDIMVPPLTTGVYAVEAGYVKSIMTTGGESSWRILIADSAGTQECEGWMYAHLRPGYFYQEVGDWVEAGDLIGHIADWSDNSIEEHIHFSRIRFGGDSTEWANGFWTGWKFIDNPLNFLDNTNINDTTAPYFANAWGEQKFAFCTNETDNYFEENESISGDVDIIAEIYDYHGYYKYQDGPYKIEYKIDGDSSIDWTTSIIFTGAFGTYEDVTDYMTVMYQNDSYCNSIYLSANYQKYYYNVTNTDGDEIVELDDKLEDWDTKYFHNGDYTVSVKASDYAGNSTTESMTITVENYFELSGNVTIINGSEGNAGAIITVSPDGSSDTTDVDGNYLIPAVSGGSQTVTITCPGCSSYDETVMMNQNQVVDGTVEFSYFCGDANGNGAINIIDITYLISFLYKSGPAPIPVEAGDANGNGVINILDITYLISFLYKSGPDPICP